MAAEVFVVLNASEVVSCQPEGDLGSSVRWGMPVCVRVCSAVGERGSSVCRGMPVLMWAVEFVVRGEPHGVVDRDCDRGVGGGCVRKCVAEMLVVERLFGSEQLDS
jgi:hypothetical protein